MRTTLWYGTCGYRKRFSIFSTMLWRTVVQVISLVFFEILEGLTPKTLPFSMFRKLIDICTMSSFAFTFCLKVWSFLSFIISHDTTSVDIFQGSPSYGEVLNPVKWKSLLAILPFLLIWRPNAFTHNLLTNPQWTNNWSIDFLYLRHLSKKRSILKVLVPSHVIYPL